MKRFKDDYEVVAFQDERGREKHKLEYRGKYFEISIDEIELLKFRRYSIFLLLPIIIAHVTAGFLNNQGMDQFYIVLPYAISFFPLFYLAWGVLRLPREKRKYQRSETELSFGHMKTSSRALLILFGIGMIGEIMFLLFFSVQERSVLEYLYLLLEAVAAIAVYALIKIQSPILVQVSEEVFADD